MSMLTVSTAITSHLVPAVGSGDQLKGQIKLSAYKLLDKSNTRTRVSLDPTGLRSKLQPLNGRCLLLPNRTRSASIVCASVNARCSQGQTQTVLRESPTITQAPVHSKEKSPDLDDGGAGFPPRDDGDGGGGGGGGGGNWSGGFFLFGFLAFLGFLKDKESEDTYQHSRKRR